MIPKIIHYCWLSNDPIPEKLQEYMASWKKYMPHYKVIKWDFNKFNKEECPWVSEAFDNKKYAFAADYIRLYALYKYGGIYLDMDVEVLKPFDDLLQYPYFLCYEHDGKVPEVAAFGAEPNQEWIKKWLAYYDNKHFVLPDETIDPKSLTPLPKIAVSQLMANGYRFTSIESPAEITYDGRNISILPCDYFSPKSYKDCKVYTTVRTYCIHHFAGSWLPKGEVLEHKFWNALGLREHYIMKHFYEITGRFLHLIKSK